MKKFLLLQTVLLLSVVFAQPLSSQSNTDYLSRSYDFIKNEFGLDAKAIGQLKIKNQYKSDHNQVEHVHLVQTINGYEIFGTSANLAFLPNGKVSATSHRLTIIDGITFKAGTPAFTAPQAIGIVAKDLGISSRNIPTLKRTTPAGTPVYSREDIALHDIPAEIGYINEGGEYKLAWKLQIQSRKNGKLYNSFVDATTGSPVANDLLTLQCSFEEGYISHSTECLDHPISLLEKFEAPPSEMPGQYRVLPVPVESPSHGSFELVTGADDPIASPYGWHDTNGAAGPEFTYTRGNNVYAFLDRNWDYAPDGTLDGGANLIFDFPFNSDNEPSGNQNAGLTNLFFWSNIMHDFAFRYGFNEVAGNFQFRNYSNIGLDEDYVEAYGQFGDNDPPLCGVQTNDSTACINNSDFSTPSDGFNPTMRMFTWDNDNSNKHLDVLEPLDLAGMILTGLPEFGPEITTEPVTGLVVVADDGTFNPSYACLPLIEQPDLDGKIVIIDRGLCDFSEKVYNAQLGGAIGAIICNFEEPVIAMGNGAFAGEVTIPSVFISKGDCDRIRVEAANGLKVSLVAPASSGGPVRRDGSLDVSILAHEYSHGISNRLTGGGTGGCLSPGIQTGKAEEAWGMGEGWSDFLALVTTVRAGDTGEKRRGIGTYVNKENNNGRGLRSYPYSTDMTVNSHTYDDILFESIPHGVGSVWAAMIWDLYWAFTDEYGFDPDLYAGTGGNNMAIQLVMDGMKLQPCGPGFIDARDAILRADSINHDGANQCLIWEVFARRGLGWNAQGGSPQLRADGIEGFESLPTCIKELKLTKTMTPEILAGDQIEVTLHAINHTGIELNNVFLEDLLPEGTSYVPGSANIAPATGNSLVWTLNDVAPLEEITITYRLQSDPGKNSVRLFIDDIEGDPYDRWEVYYDEEKTTDNIWTPQDVVVHSGVSAWNVGDVSTESEHFLENYQPYEVSGDQPVYRFYHYYNTEPGADGGFLEISTDDGESWISLENKIFRNSYPRSLQYSTFAIPNLKAFSGLSHPELVMTPVYIDLSDYAGQEVFIRYRFGTDANTAGDGWYVDDVEIMDAVIYNSTACISSDQTDLVCAEAPQRGTIVDSQITIGTEDQNDDAALSVYPNPAGDFIEITLSAPKTENAEINVFDLTGQLLYSGKWNLTEGFNQQVINLSRFMSGMYVINIRSGESFYSKKFIKE